MIELNGVRDALATLTANTPRFYRAPGRLNLIGDHVDYSEGFVLPIAIDRMTLLAAAKRRDRIVRLRSLARGETVEFDLDDGDDRPRAGWNDDVRRIALGLEKRGAVLRGSDVAVRTTIPLHSGLASSASPAHWHCWGRPASRCRSRKSSRCAGRSTARSRRSPRRWANAITRCSSTAGARKRRPFRWCSAASRSWSATRTSPATGARLSASAAPNARPRRRFYVPICAG